MTKHNSNVYATELRQCIREQRELEVQIDIMLNFIQQHGLKEEFDRLLIDLSYSEDQQQALEREIHEVLELLGLDEALLASKVAEKKEGKEDE